MVIVSTSIFNDGVMSVIEQFVSPGCCITCFYPCLWSAPLRKDSLRGLSLWRWSHAASFETTSPKRRGHATKDTSWSTLFARRFPFPILQMDMICELWLPTLRLVPNKVTILLYLSNTCWWHGGQALNEVSLNLTGTGRGGFLTTTPWQHRHCT